MRNTSCSCIFRVTFCSGELVENLFQRGLADGVLRDRQLASPRDGLFHRRERVTERALSCRPPAVNGRLQEVGHAKMKQLDLLDVADKRAKAL